MPDPTRPPAKKRKGRIICGSAPPDRSSTMPVRRMTSPGFRTRHARERLASQSSTQMREEIVAGRRLFGFADLSPEGP